MTELKVVDFSGLSANHPNFKVLPLKDLLVDYPQLEFAHRRDFYVLAYIVDAEGRLVIDHVGVRADRAKIVIIKPDAILSIELNRLAQGYLICFREEVFSLRYNDNVFKQFRFLEQRVFAVVRMDEALVARWTQLCEWTLLESGSQSKESERVFRSYLNILLVDLERKYTPIRSFERIEAGIQSKISVFEEYIERHFLRLKKPSDYADLMNITPNYLNKICKEVRHQTAGSMIRNRIVIEAKRLLLYTSNTISQIADRLGFESTSYFVASFKKQTGQTPEQFRRGH